MNTKINERKLTPEAQAKLSCLQAAAKINEGSGSASTIVLGQAMIFYDWVKQDMPPHTATVQIPGR